MQGDQVKVPLYYQLVKTLIKQINNEMAINDRLPSEKEIGAQYSVSRTTVRLALAELERTGYIYRLQGKGSFVSARRVHVANSFFDLAPQPDTENVVDQFDVKMLQFKNERPTSKIAQLMNINVDQSVVRVSLLVQLHDEPVMLDTFLIRNQPSHFLTSQAVKKDPYQALADEDFNFHSVEETYAVRPQQARELTQLKTSPDEQLLVLNKHYYDDSNRIVLINERRVVTSRYHYQNFISVEAFATNQESNND